MLIDMMRAQILGLLLITTACSASAPDPVPTGASNEFPKADRPVASIISSRWSTEEERDRLREADRVMDLAEIKPGMTIADIGAGEGYYTIRLSARVGKTGRVLAQDIIPEYRDTLALRVERERLDNVSVTLGVPADPKLPPNSFDRILLVHMYHEIATPYEFLWRLRPSLREGGRVVIVDADRPTENHGTPPKLLECELKAVGFAQVAFKAMPQAGGYLAMFEARGPAPEPRGIKPCAI
jgi:ubiquinone/menaquinone biosynthesis C-methylase UbiE